MNTEYKLLGSTDGLFTNLLNTTSDRKYGKRVKAFYPTNYYGIVQVLDASDRNNLLVKFLDDDSTRLVSLPNLIKGKCRNTNTSRRWNVELSEQFEDVVYSNKSGCEFRILWRKGPDCEVLFTATGNKVKALIANATKGKVTDYLNPSVYGVGFLGTDDGLSVKFKNEYTLWHNMLKRAYCEKDTKGYYGRVSVDERWFNFSNFLEDVTTLQNYSLWLAGQLDKTQTRYNLDKDFAYFGCTHYSKNNCQFIDESLNKGTTSRTVAARSRINKYKRSLNV